MRKEELQRYRKLLERRRADVIRAGLKSLRAGRQRNQLEMEQARDEGDEAARMLQSDTELRMSERDMALVQQIEAALARLDQGEFGVCVDCGEAIEPERLRAVPWALRCITDQEAREQELRVAGGPPTL